ncbi:MAG: NACHT domain-containing protein [Cyanobacteriota bacterium]
MSDRPDPERIQQRIFEHVQSEKITTGDITQNIYFDSRESGTVTRLTSEDSRNRQVLLDKVSNYWVKGVLETSLHGRVLIELNLEERLDAVAHPGDRVWETSDQPRQALPPGTRVSDKFDEMEAGRSLLILGEPGSGKTTTLLEITRDLIAQAKSNTSQPIPVVFNLSSWSEQKQAIANWLVQELHTEYKVPKTIGAVWVEDKKLLLLLDGLDEVKAECRESCVQALNQFIQEYRQTEMVVCSCTKDYEALSQRLILQTAIYLQPLTLDQVKPYLPKVGPKLVIDRAALQKVIALLGALLPLSLLLVNILPLPKPPSPSREDTYLVVNWAKNGKDHLAVRTGGCVLMDLNFIDNIFKRIPDVERCYGKGDKENQYLVGDWDGNGIDELAYRRGNEVWRDLKNSDNGTKRKGFGFENQEYLVGDWDGDGRDSLAVRSITEKYNCVTMESIDGGKGSSKTLCYDDIPIDKEDKFLAGDWDGDGRDSLAVRQGNDVHIDSNSDAKFDKHNSYKDVDIKDQFLVGDWDGDGKDNVGIRKGNHVLTMP